MGGAAVGGGVPSPAPRAPADGENRLRCGGAAVYNAGGSRGRPGRGRRTARQRARRTPRKEEDTMATNTQKQLRNLTMYSVYVRNYSEEGTFEAVRRDLPRIRALGVDLLWFLPIHPVGQVRRKGALGSPYAISDYRAVNPEYGTREDFVRLVDEAHRLGMRCLIDVVYNHTAPDSVLAREHPEWFYHRPDGTFGNRIGDWTDVIDLDYSHPALWDYQIETLRQWAAIVDGFRCDVAPLVPLAFWLRAREAVEAVRPGCLWLAETVEPEFIAACRAAGIPALSDGEMYQAFDVCYEYDVYHEMERCLLGTGSLDAYAAALNRQESLYPDNYIKLRFLENHDRARAHFLIPDGRALRNWTAFLYLQKGLTLLYAGQEYACTHRPSLFEKDVVPRAGEAPLSGLLAALARIRKDPLLADGSYTVRALPGDALLCTHRGAAGTLAGAFSLRGTPAVLETGLPDGVYENRIDGSPVEIYEEQLAINGKPIVLVL